MLYVWSIKIASFYSIANFFIVINNFIDTSLLFAYFFKQKYLIGGVDQQKVHALLQILVILRKSK